MCNAKFSETEVPLETYSENVSENPVDLATEHALSMKKLSEEQTDSPECEMNKEFKYFEATAIKSDKPK